VSTRITRSGWVLAASVAGSLCACQLLFPTVQEAPDAHAPTDAGPYHDLTSSAEWSFYDIGKNTPGYTGGVFDGRYVYMPPFGGAGPVVRYDTHASFTATSSWNTFDTSKLSDAGLNIYSGAAFDGRYVYLVPYNDGLVEDIVFVQYDTHEDFATPSSYAQFDGTLLLDKSIEGFSGSTFDGRYVYFVPDVTGLAVRYDTKGTFTSPLAWEKFDTTTVNSGASGQQGAVFDGRYVYFIPSTNEDSPLDGGCYSGDPDGILVRYDTMGQFTDKASWSVFDTSAIGSQTIGFAGGVFDGRYVYLIPLYSELGVVVRYDTELEFTKAASWSTFTANDVNPQLNGFFGGAFDGRFVYLVPNATDLKCLGVAARYDTKAPFTDAAAWQAYNLEMLNSEAFAFAGAVFDGQYLYFVPYNGAVVARFDARSPPAMPQLPDFFGSFF
jgi:hypothetical protein